MIEERIGLETLLPDISIDQFLKEHYPTKAFVQHGDVQRLTGLCDCEFVRHPKRLLTRSPEKSLIVFLRQPDGSTRHLRVDKRDAHLMYDAGMSVTVEAFDDVVPAGKGWASALNRDIGYGVVAADCAAILSPIGASVPMHFDGIELLSVVLRGRKKWRFAPNQQVQFPRDGYFVCEQGAGQRNPHSRRPHYFPNESLICEMPSLAEEVELVAGSVFFMPRGWWHETECMEESFSLTFKIPSFTGLDFVLAGLRNILEKDSRWRKPLPPGFSNKDSHSALLDHLDELIQDLRGNRKLDSKSVIGALPNEVTDVLRDNLQLEWL